MKPPTQKSQQEIDMELDVWWANYAFSYKPPQQDIHEPVSRREKVLWGVVFLVVSVAIYRGVTW